MFTGILFTKLQRKSKHFIQNGEILNTAKYYGVKFLLYNRAIGIENSSLLLRFERNCLHFVPSFLLQFSYTPWLAVTQSSFAARNNVMSIDAQLAVEQTRSCRHKLIVFVKRLQYKCTICCRPQLKHWADKLHVVVRERLPLQ